MEENYQYVDDLPSATVVPETKLPEFKIENITNQFKSTFPQYTRVKETVPLTESETLDQIADRLNNTPTDVNYVPNILAPIEVDVDTSRYEGVDINLGKLQSGKLEQYAAQTQSYWDRLWNDTKVTGANLGIGFATAFTSIYDMINDGSFIPSEDSATSKLGTISSEFAEKNSNFKTQYDIDNPIKSLLLPSFLTGSSSGWGEIAKSASIGIGTGAGIFVQELGVTALTGGTGTIPTLAANVRNLIRNSKVIEQAAQTTSGLKAGATSIKAGIASVEAANAAVETGNVTSNIINFGKNTVRGALSAYGESAFEAQETRDSFTLEKIKEFKDRNGYLPTGADLEKIKNVAEQAHDARFLLNFGLLTVSNMPFLNSVFKQFDDVMSVSEQAAAKGLKYTGRAGDGFEKSFQLKSDWWTKNAVTKAMKTAIETGQPYLKNIATGKSITWTEGLEEGYQYWVDKATNNYYNTLYNKGTNDIIDGTVTDTIFGLANSFYQTKDQLITPEGLQNIIGGIMGGTGQSIVSKGIDVAKNGFENQWKEGSKFRTETTEQIQSGLQDILEVQKAVDIDSITGTLKEKLDSLRGAYAGVGLMQETNNVITFNKLKDIAKWHTIAPLVMRGQTDIIKDQLTSTLQDLGDDQFKQMTGVENVTPATKNEYISKVINDINKVDKSIRKNLNTFRNRYKKGSEEYNLYEDAKKIFAFHGYLSEGMIENKKQLENQNSVLFNSPNIASALDLVINGKRRTDLVNTIDAQLTMIDSTLDTLEPIVKEGEIAEISKQNKQLKTQLENQKKNYERLKENVNNFQGENREKVTEFLVDVIDTFNQTELVFNDPNLNIENQVKDLLEKYNDYTILSENLADHLETYNNLIKYYSDPTDLKETLIKYREQANLTQLSFKDLDAAKAYDYFTKKINEVRLPLDSEYIQIINTEFRKLQNEKASFEDYKEVVDKNIEQFLKENPVSEEETETTVEEEPEPNPEDVTFETVRDKDLKELKDYLTNLQKVKNVTEDDKIIVINDVNTILKENPEDEEIKKFANQILKLLEEKTKKPVTVSDVINISEQKIEIKDKIDAVKKEIENLEKEKQQKIIKFNFLNKNNKKEVVLNGINGILSKINNFRYELENNDKIYEFTFDEIKEFKSVTKLEKYKINNLTENTVTVNNVNYIINVDNIGNVESISPENNKTQNIKNESLILAVEIERNKLETFNKKENKLILDDVKKNYPNIDLLLNTIWEFNMNETIANALDKLYDKKNLKENELLQISLWLSDIFDRISILIKKDNTQYENETLLNAYNTAEIINSLLYNLKNINLNKNETRQKVTDVGEIKNTISSKKDKTTIKNEIKSELVKTENFDEILNTEENSLIEKLNEELQNLEKKSKEVNKVVISDIVNVPEKETKKTPKSIEEQITDLRAKEQEELKKAIPNIDDYKIDGKVDEKLLQGEDLIKFNKIYEKYDKLITPLLKKQNQETTTEEKLDVETGSINSKTVESTVYIDEEGKIISLQSKEGAKVGIKNAKKVEEVLLSEKDLDVEDLTFEKVTSPERKSDVLKYDRVFIRQSSDKAIQVKDNDDNFITLIQTPKNLILNIEEILKLGKDFTEEERETLNNNKGINVVDALTTSLFDAVLFDKLKKITTKTDNETHSILVVNEDYETFKNTILTQAKNFDLLIESKDVKKDFKELYSGFQAYANGMNFKYNITEKKVEGSLSQKKKKEVENKVLFTDNLPFNYVGEWKQPVFTIEDDLVVPLNGKDVNNRDEYRIKIEKTLEELKQNLPKFYDILINNGSYFTAFSDQNGKVWIKPISLSLYNSNEKIEEIVFEDGKLNEDKIKEVSDKYIITAYDNNKEGNSVKIKLFENKGLLTLEFSKKIGNEKVAYYLNNVKQEELKDILNGTSTLKPEINQKSKKALVDKGYKLNDTLEYYNVSIIEHSAKANRLELLTNGKYYVTGVSNPVSIFQNVGFRLKFKEKKEDVSIEATTSPSIVQKAEKIKIEERVTKQKTINENEISFYFNKSKNRFKGKEIMYLNNTFNYYFNTVLKGYFINQKGEILEPINRTPGGFNYEFLNLNNNTKTLYSPNSVVYYGKDYNSNINFSYIDTKLFEEKINLYNREINELNLNEDRKNILINLIDNDKLDFNLEKELNNIEYKFVRKYKSLKDIKKELKKGKENNAKYDAELKALEEPKQKQEELKAPVEEYIESLPVETKEVIEEAPIEEKNGLQEISDYVWNNFKMGKAGKEYTVYELKDNLDISELNRRFVELKNADKRNIVSLENKFKKDFTNKLTVKEFVKRGELPSQRAFLEDNTEIVNQYVKNCK